MSHWAQARLLDFVREATGVHLEPDMGISCGVRLAEVMRHAGIEDLDELVATIEAEPGHSELRRSSIEALLNNETLFFRDIAFFNMLRDFALPRLVEARQRERRLRIWSAACSTGQEAYSIAMLLDAHFPQLATWKVELVATDYSRPNLARAKSGIYTQLEVNRGLPAKFLIEYFEKCDDGHWQMRPDIRERVTFQQLNLLATWPTIPECDLVIMRNILIYWDTETKREVLGRVQRQLAKDGLLALGGAETPYLLDDAYSRVGTARYTCYELRSKGAAGVAL